MVAWDYPALALFLLSCAVAEGTVPLLPEGYFIVKSEFDGPTPDDAFLVSLEADGTLRGLLGHEIDESDFKSLLANGGITKPSVLKVVIEDNKKTSVATLAHLLSTLRQAADPKRKIIVYLHLGK